MSAQTAGVVYTISLTALAAIALGVVLVLARSMFRAGRTLATRAEAPKYTAGQARGHPGGVVPGYNSEPYRGPAVSFAKLPTIAGTDVRWMIELAKDRDALDELERTGRLPW